MTEHPAGMPREPYAAPASEQNDAGAPGMSLEDFDNHVDEPTVKARVAATGRRAEVEEMDWDDVGAGQEMNEWQRGYMTGWRHGRHGADKGLEVPPVAVEMLREDFCRLRAENERLRREAEDNKALAKGEADFAWAQHRALGRRLAEVEKKLQSMEGLERARKWLEEQES